MDGLGGPLVLRRADQPSPSPSATAASMPCPDLPVLGCGTRHVGISPPLGRENFGTF